MIENTGWRRARAAGAALAFFVTALACCVARGAPDGPASREPAFTASGKEFRFDTGVLAGLLRRGGRSSGLGPVSWKKTAAPVAQSLGLFSPYRLLAKGSRFGTAAWDWASTATLQPDGGVRVQWTADAKHPLDLTAVYRWRAPGTLDLTLTATARKDTQALEFFLASYFQGFAEAVVYSRTAPGGEAAFLPATKAEGQWQMFPRDAAAAGLIQDGRWQRPPHPVAWKIRPRLAAPLAMRRDAKTGLAAVVMAPPDDCFAVATPFGEDGHRSLYLCLLGRDLKAGQAATVRARLVIGAGLTDEKAVALYEAYIKELARARKGER